MVATMAAAESGWGTSKLARANNNLFGMKCGKGCKNGTGSVNGWRTKFDSVKESVQDSCHEPEYAPGLCLVPCLALQLRKTDQEVTATAMIHKLKGYSTKGSSYNDYLFAMYQDNQRLIAAAHM